MQVESLVEASVRSEILEAGLSLEPVCAVASSPHARGLKAFLRTFSPRDEVVLQHLFVYCELDWLNLCRCVLAVGVSPDSCWGPCHIPVLCAAARNGSIRCLRALLDAGADVKLEQVDGKTALHEAVAAGATDCVLALVKAKAPLEARWLGFRTPLVDAVCGGHIDACKILLLAGASPRTRSQYTGAEPLHHAAEGGHAHVMDLLLRAGASVDARDDEDCTPLSYAARKGRLAAARRLLELGASASAVGCWGDTPLMWAALFEHPLVVQELIPVTDLSITNMCGMNALHISGAVGNKAMFDILVPHFTNLDVRTGPGTQPDGTAVQSYHLTPLHLACTYGHHAVVKALLRLGASRTAISSLSTGSGNSPLHLAVLYGSVSCVVDLLGYGVMGAPAVNFSMVPGWTALHVAAMNGDHRVCGILIQAGARLDVLSDYGDTPLASAQREHLDNAPLLELLSGNCTGPLPGTVCERCAALPDSQLMHCGGCHSVRYCCPRCATADWPRHAAYCKQRREAQAAIHSSRSIFESSPRAGGG